ncbi:MAG: transposase DNA-binding-containing protein, partial [Gammaproteobacteria bacterium]|nr:transposase DNA-binding-containing protein [Gammaproteobacteria bacterium]
MLETHHPEGWHRSGIRRAVWVKPLSLGWREQLCTLPRRALGWSYPVSDEIVDWAGREYDRCCYPDGRMCRRVVEMGRRWMRRPGRPLPAIFPNPAEQKAAYRV